MQIGSTKLKNTLSTFMFNGNCFDKIQKATHHDNKTLLLFWSNYVLFLLPYSSFQQLRRACYLPIIAAMLCTNLCATVMSLSCIFQCLQEYNTKYSEVLLIIFPPQSHKSLLCPSKANSSY